MRGAAATEVWPALPGGCPPLEGSANSVASTEIRGNQSVFWRSMPSDLIRGRAPLRVKNTGQN